MDDAGLKKEERAREVEKNRSKTRKVIRTKWSLCWRKKELRMK